MRFLLLFLNLIKRNSIKSFFTTVLLMIAGFICYVIFLTSCTRLTMFNNNDLIKMLKDKNNDIFILNDNIRECHNKNYTPYLLEAIKKEYKFSGNKLIFKSYSLNSEANFTLNELYNKSMYYYNSFTFNGYKFNKEKALAKTDDTIKFWNEYLKDKK